MRPESGRYLVRSRSEPEIAGQRVHERPPQREQANVAVTNRLPDLDGTGIEVADAWAAASATPTSPPRPESSCRIATTR